MPAKTRRVVIEERILELGQVDFASLAREFGVSEMTIRRDIEALEDKGVAKRVLGGAIAFSGKSWEPPFESRAAEAAPEKAHIATAAASLLQPGETALFDSGSTVLAVARAVKGRGLGLTVVTPSILVALELADEPDTTVLLTGGRVRPSELSLVGPETEAAFALYNCDTYLMGIAGVDAAHGVSDYHREEGSMKRAAMNAADRVIVVADESKLGRVQLMNIAPLAALSVLVTDGDPEHPTLVAARKAGVEVVCVDAPAEATRPAGQGA